MRLSLRVRHKAWARPELEACEFFERDPVANVGLWRKKFSMCGPLHVELGCGKGLFVAKKAKENPTINFMGIDIKNEMLVWAKRQIEEKFLSNGGPQNLKITIWNIEHIAQILAMEDGVERIYINFCNPWPKARHQKRRLTHPRQLLQYRQFLETGGKVYFKTDDMALFFDTLEYFKEANFKVLSASQDLLPCDLATEHEQMFRGQGLKIKGIIAQKMG